MKTLTIGRANDCDIVIDDDSDQVSRHHVELAFTFGGTMFMTDLSANGTYVNGVRMKKGEAMVVRCSDNISLAKVWNFDWDTVTDPYQPYRRLLGFSIAILAVLILAAGAYLLWGRHWATDDRQQIAGSPTEVGDTIVTDTLLSLPQEQSVAPVKSSNSNIHKKSKPNTFGNKKPNIIIDNNEMHETIVKEDNNIPSTSEINPEDNPNTPIIY